MITQVHAEKRGLSERESGDSAQSGAVTDRKDNTALSGSCMSFGYERRAALEHVYGAVRPGDKCLVVPMGGGGDCIGAALPMYDLVKNLGADVVMLGLTLKRPSQTNTAKPLGCMPLADFSQTAGRADLQRIINEHALHSIGLVAQDTLGPAGLLIDEVRLSRHCAKAPDWASLAPQIGLLDPSDGIESVANDLERLLSAANFKHVYFVDVGGDVVTEGADEDKKTLWSPVLDEMMNFVAVRLEAKFPTRTLVAGLGGDGEITHERFVHQHGEISQKGGFFGGIAFPPDAVSWYRELLKDAATETSRQILIALDRILENPDWAGQYLSVQRHLNALVETTDSRVNLSDLFLFEIPVSLRSGTRTSELNVLTPYVLSYRPSAIADSNQFSWLASSGKSSFADVVETFRSRGFRTELDNKV